MVRKKRKFEETNHAKNYCQIGYDWAVAASRDVKGVDNCLLARQAAERQIRDLDRSESDDEFPFYFDPHHGNDICDFAEKMHHVEGEWETKEITLEGVQIFILSTIFGWRRKSDGKRRFTSVYIEMARKGAKSTLTAVVSLYCLNCEGEVGPQILIGATTGDQARKVFKPASLMAKKNADFRDHFGVEVWAHSITSSNNDGFIQPINSKSGTQDGHNPHVGILDELHAHKDRGLYDVIKSAFGSRKNPLLWAITTAGYNVDGVCYDQHKLVRKILSGAVSIEHYFGIIFTLDEGDDVLDRSTWNKANPMLGITPTMDSMENYAREAEQSPTTMGEFKTKRLNVWTTAKGAWLNFERWKRCTGKLDLDRLVEIECYGGLDLSSTSDITAFNLIWLRNDSLSILSRFWLPEDVIDERTTKANVPYRAWQEQGFLIPTPGERVDYSFVEKEIRELLEMFKIKAIGFDRWNSSSLVNNLLADGAPLIRVAQGPQSFNTPMDELERHVTNGTLAHNNNPVLSWMASNIVARRDQNDNKAPDKKNSMEKIDGIVASLNAIFVGMQLGEQGFDPVAAIA